VRISAGYLSPLFAGVRSRPLPAVTVFFVADTGPVSAGIRRCLPVVVLLVLV
jgi:hypothetical protein